MATSTIKHIDIPKDAGSANYSKQADGTLICWGTSYVANGAWARQVYFPANFINTSYSATVTFIINDTAVHNVAANGKAKNYMNVNRITDSGNHYFDWMAVGRWK